MGSDAGDGPLHAARRAGVRLSDGALRLTGGMQYAADLTLPGMLHARLVLSPHPHARIIKIDLHRAQSLPGVAAALSAQDLPGVSPAPASRSHALLAVDRVVFLGQPVVVVLAED